MKIYWKPLVGLMTTFLLVGCQTKETAARYKAAQTDALTCQQRVLAYKEKLATTQVTFKDERNALMYMVVQELAKVKASDEMAACTRIYTAMIEADSRKTGKLVDGSFRLGGIALGLIGVDLIVDGINELGNNGGSSETWNVSGSRVVNRSTATDGSTISSSGEGMGIGNVFGGRTAQGGIQPRQWQTGQGTTVTEVNTESQSGENAPDRPIEGGDGATILPFE